MFALRQITRSAPRVAQSLRAFASEAPADKIKLSLTSPVQSFYNDVLVNQPGVVSVFTTDGAENKFFVSSGTITVNADSSVQVIAEEAVPLDHLDVNLARKGLDSCTSKLNSGSDAEKAEAEIGVEVYTSIIRALEG